MVVAMNVRALEEAHKRMVGELADAAMIRYYSALKEGKSERQAFEEIISTVLKAYRDALAS